MDADKNLNFIMSAVYAVMPGILVLAAGILVVSAFRADELKSLLKLVVPLAFYVSCLSGAFAVRKRKSRSLKFDGGGEDTVTITVSYMALFWHDALVFGTPFIIILAAYLLNGAVDSFDILVSAIACVGLYLSELLYKRA